MVAEIISVGTELLMGQIVNSDAQYIAKKLNELGIDHFFQCCVGDNYERLSSALSNALIRSDIIITSGGLGPTNDDMTKECIAKFTNKDLTLDEDSYFKIKSFMLKMDKEFTPNNEKQAYFPKNSIILENSIGTAPGFIIELDNNKIIIVLPGPPKELITMFENHVMKYLKNKCDDVLYTKNVQIFDVGESKLEFDIKDLIDNQINPTIATYCHPGYVTVRVTAKACNQEEAIKLVQPTINILKDRFKNKIFEIGDRTLSEVVCDYLIKNNITISVSESCSGGLVSDAMVQKSGISSVYKLGVTSYSNEAKINVLGVDNKILNDFGAVSYQTAIQMADGVRKLGNSNIGISTTGIAGPKSDDTKKPVGLVYIALSTPNETIYKELHLKGSRAQIRNLTVLNVFNMIRNYYMM